MTCTRCGRDVENDSTFCRFCGASQQGGVQGRRLARLPDQARVAGVCAGLAAYFDVDPTFVRLAWVLLSIVPGGIVGGVVAYALAWVVMPPIGGAVAPPAGRRLFRSATDVQIGGVCAGIAEYVGGDPTVVRVLWVLLTIVPGAIVLGVLAYAVAWVVIPRAPSSPLHPATTTP